jgi:hypothetical protein
LSGKTYDLQDENVELKVETVLNPSEDPEKVKNVYNTLQMDANPF